MVMTINKSRVPVNFELIEDGENKDNRFRKVKIWVAHTEENLNNTYFTKEVLTEMSETLTHIPIVGFIEKNSENEDDFSDHRNKIVIKNGGVDIAYAGHAYGFIPEDNNHQFEFRGGKEWLTCEGYIWTKFKETIDLFDNQNGVKSQSMEIQEVNGYADDLGRMVFTTGRFSALCILGEETEPAMAGSTIEYYSTKDKYQEEINQMMVEFSKQEGESALNEEQLAEFAKKEKEKAAEADKAEKAKEAEKGKVSKPTEPAKTGEGDKKPAATKEGEEPTKETKETKPGKEDKPAEGKEVPAKEAKSKEDKPAEGKEATDPKKEVPAKKDEKSKKKNFSITKDDSSFVVNYDLSHSEIRRDLITALRGRHENSDDISVYVVDVFDGYCVYEYYNYKESKNAFYRVEYTQNGDEISIGSQTEVVGVFVTKEEKAQIEANRTKIVDLTNELKDLQEYKVSNELSAKEELVSNYAEALGTEGVEKLKANFSKMSIEEVEKEVAYTCFQKSKGKSKDEMSETRATNFSANNTNGRYGALDSYFN